MAMRRKTTEVTGEPRPRPRLVFTRRPRSVRLKTQSSTTTSETPPAVSLPMTTAPWPSCMEQWVTRTAVQGGRTGRSMESLPLLMATQSSPTENSHPETSTPVQLSGLTPSVLGGVGRTFRARQRNLASRQSTGCTFQLGLSLRVPTRATLSHPSRKTRRGRAAARMRLGSCHLVSAVAWPSTVPGP